MEPFGGPFKIYSPVLVADPSVQEVQVSEQIVVTAGNVNEEEVHYPQNGQASIEQEASLPVVIDENSEDSVNVPKNSYASIVSSLLKHPVHLTF